MDSQSDVQFCTSYSKVRYFGHDHAKVGVKADNLSLSS